MDALNLGIEWAQAEVFTNSFFIGFGALFIVASIGFWIMGKSKMAKAYIFPLLVGGILLSLLGWALVDLYAYYTDSLPLKFNTDPNSFVASEIDRTTAGIAQYKNDLFGVFPFVMAASALLIIFIKRNIWRAIFITVIAMSSVIMLVDSQAIAFLEQYNSNLKTALNQ